MQQKQSEAQIRALKDKLELAKLPNVRLLDPQTIAVSTSVPAVAGEVNFTIRVQPIADDIARKDALGLAQRVYNPHVALVLVEASIAHATTLALLRAQSELAKAALGMEAYAIASGAANRAADPDTDTKILEIRDVEWPLAGEQ